MGLFLYPAFALVPDTAAFWRLLTIRLPASGSFPPSSDQQTHAGPRVSYSSAQTLSAAEREEAWKMVLLTFLHVHRCEKRSAQGFIGSNKPIFSVSPDLVSQPLVLPWQVWKRGCRLGRDLLFCEEPDRQICEVSGTKVHHYRKPVAPIWIILCLFPNHLNWSIIRVWTKFIKETERRGSGLKGSACITFESGGACQHCTDGGDPARMKWLVEENSKGTRWEWVAERSRLLGCENGHLHRRGGPAPRVSPASTTERLTGRQCTVKQQNSGRLRGQSAEQCKLTKSSSVRPCGAHWTVLPPPPCTLKSRQHGCSPPYDKNMSAGLRAPPNVKRSALKTPPTVCRLQLRCGQFLVDLLL